MTGLFVADESVDFPIVEALRARGIEVLYVAEMDPGIDDATVLEEAHRRQAPLLTQDRDFNTNAHSFAGRLREVLRRLRRLAGRL